MKRAVPEFEYSEEQLNSINSLAASCGLLPDTVKILYARGIDDKEKIERFIHPSREHFVSPFKMSGMSDAVRLITRARDEEWQVVVYGDYDADGVCAATVMCAALRDFGIEPVAYIPERRDGYGLNVKAIDDIFEEHFPQLFITVDCGISCAEEVEYIKEQGAEIIITDHHELPDRLPDCICINPKFNDGYIYDNLCGAGVALKVAVALNGESAYKYLDFAAIATVADSVPLTGENRDIVSEGLKLINQRPRKCYAQFLGKNDVINSHALAFGISPKINAAGRMGDARSALELFGATDENLIFDLSAKLTSYNLERQKYCDELYASAKSKLKEGETSDKIIMLWDESWNAGFVGIVAARLTEEYSRPAMLFVRNGDKLKGSARSVENINVFEALKACAEYIAEFGGHSQAAGVNIEIENFEILRAALNKYLTENYSAADFESRVYISGSLSGGLSTRFAKELDLLEPFGVGNRRPLFIADVEAAEVAPVKQGSPHISVKSGNLSFMYFGGARFTYLLESRAPKRFIFEYNVSKFRGKEYVKGFIRDLIPSRSAGGLCTEEIAVNNILTLGGGRVSVNRTLLSAAEHDEISDGGYGSVYIASEYATLSHYENLNGLPVELFTLTCGNLSDTVLVSPSCDVDLSGYKRVVFLDDSPIFDRFASLEGKDVIVCGGVSGCNFIKNLNASREELLKIFGALLATPAASRYDSVSSVALSGCLGYPPAQTAFALEVFRQLSLIGFGGGKLTVNRGVKTDLTNSELYNLVKAYENRT